MGHAPLSLVLLLIGILANSQGEIGLNKRKLSDYVHHYEELKYDTDDIHAQHHRHKRSAPEDEDRVRVYFHSHGRPFDLELERDHSVFHNNLIVERNNEAFKPDLSHIYHGKLIGEPDSHCFGAIRDGVFDGQIHTATDGIYYVERANRYFPQDLKELDDQEDTENTTSSQFHSVIYHENHLIDPFHHSRKVNIGLKSPGCGISESTQSWMDSIQHSGEQQNEDNRSNNKEDPIIYQDTFEVENEEERKPSYKYSKQGQNRIKRSINPKPNPSSKKSCTLYIQTDPLFWLHVQKQEKRPEKIEEEILSLIAQHVKAVNRIYSDTSFDGKYKHNGYQFEVQRIKIHNDTKCGESLSRRLGGTNSNSKASFLQSLEFVDKAEPFCTPNVDVSNFLNLHSKDDHADFCLAYVFTYRDFTGGTLGLAWVASASGASGGICETYKRYTENINGVHHTAKRSLNTGIITFVNYNSPVPPKVSQLTLAHEIGHNFGSPHDFPSDCRPGDPSGNFIMFASATSGNRDNNNKFSHCSKANISAVLDAVAEGRKRNCFQESSGAFCGNKIVEEGEECDCGYDDQECQENCCYPRNSDELSDDESKVKRCTFRPNAECSPSQGPCCDQQCRFTSIVDDVQCSYEGDCTLASKCDGRAAQCPEPGHKPDNVTECNQGTQVCQQGECRDSICVKYGWTGCQLSSETVVDKRQLCELACQKPGNNNTCISTADLVARGELPDLKEGISLRPSSACDNYQGYCDVFLKCRKVDAEGPLVRLKNLLFNQETFLTISTWVTQHWWAVLLMGIAMVIFMAIFIKCCAIHTPSSNPRLPKNLHFTETLRRPVRSLQQKGVYVGSWVIQGNVPPKADQPATIPQVLDHHHHPEPMMMTTDLPSAPPLELEESDLDFRFLHYRQANSGPSPYNRQASSSGEAPPPYPGPSRGGPGHGYGEGRGHYNRASNHPAEFRQSASAGHQAGASASGWRKEQGRGRSKSGGRQGQNRHSQMEMQPIR